MTKLPLLEYAPWSPSKGAMAAKCALAFKYQYVDKIKSEFKSSVSKIGTTVHRAQELLFQDVPLANALQQSIEEAKDLTSTEEEKVKTFAEAMSSFYNRITTFSKKYNVTELFTERKWAITECFTPCDFFDENGMIRGVVDMGLVVDGSRLIVIDHKSGRVKPMSEFGVQLDFYTVMAQVYFPQIKSVQCAIHFVANEKLVWNPPRTATYITDVLRPWLINYLNSRTEDIAGFNPRTGRHCGWCEYKNICPAFAAEKP